MPVTIRTLLVIFAAAVLLPVSLRDARAQSVPGLGALAGVESGADRFFAGGQIEVGPVFGFFHLVPSIYFTFDDGSTLTTVNGDFRAYLLPLPETGIRLYGAAGPTFEVSSDTDVGLTLAAGVNIPMKSTRRYNIEARFGFGDIPDLRIAAAVMFGL